MKVTDKPPKQRTEVRQAALIEAALQLAAQRSPADITTGDLAQAVGITQGAVFRHFASKEAIWLAALDWVSQTLMGRLQDAATNCLGHQASANVHLTPACAAASVGRAAEQPSALAALQAVFMAHVDFVTEHPGVPRVIFQELQRPGDTALKARVGHLLQQYRQLLAGLLIQAQSEKTIAPHADLQGAAVLFIGSIQGLVMQSLVSGDVADMARQAPAVFAILQRGLQAPSPSLTEKAPR
ncbi:MAG TPA: TetR family transcriptional regulator [Rhodoferax sp.]|nr:TetR family transcriptional regulator [Rhodoferax sp.]